eukprot:TRINITY_DN6635_c1_g2_i1.p1 TRINITY_DN6635_c1_g2~~TRINITY_DN6635_c1_g2_i1.p1  ORF type:complete len:108 (+),score=7.37 TRINITY_DN6635_c1_g2_i1:1357-1680(+)
MIGSSAYSSGSGRLSNFLRTPESPERLKAPILVLMVDSTSVIFSPLTTSPTSQTSPVFLLPNPSLCNTHLPSHPLIALTKQVPNQPISSIFLINHLVLSPYNIRSSP